MAGVLLVANIWSDHQRVLKCYEDDKETWHRIFDGDDIIFIYACWSKKIINREKRKLKTTTEADQKNEWKHVDEPSIVDVTQSSGKSFNKWSEHNKFKISIVIIIIEFLVLRKLIFIFLSINQTSRNYSSNQPWSDEWISGECRSYTQVRGERDKKRDLIKFLTFNSKNHSIVTTRRQFLFLESKSLFFFPSFFDFFDVFWFIQQKSY